MAWYRLEEADVEVSRTCCGTKRIACVVNLTHFIRLIMAHGQPLENTSQNTVPLQHTIWVPRIPKGGEGLC